MSDEPLEGVYNANINKFEHDEHNANKGTDRGRKALDESMKSVGYTEPMVASADGKILSGNKRQDICIDQDMNDAIVIETDGKRPIIHVRTDVQSGTPKAAEIAIAANRVAELGLEWDIPQLEHALDDLNLDLSEYFEIEELKDLGIDLGEEPPEDLGPQIDIAEELQKKWQTERGQLWVIPSKATPGKSHRVLCGDSTVAEDAKRLMGGELADAVVTDPPYGIDWDTDYTRCTGGVYPSNSMKKVLGDDVPFDPSPYFDYSSVVLFGANFYADKLPHGTWLVWDKRFENGEAFLADGELAWMKGGTGVYIHSITSQGFVRPERVQHQTQKPIALMEWCFEKCKAGELVYDPYLGSGTVAIVCERTNRICAGAELSPAYVAVCLERLAALGLEPILSETD